MRIDRLNATEYAVIMQMLPATMHAAGSFNREPAMTTHTLTLRATRAGAPHAPRQQAMGVVARWCAGQFTRPLYHHLGAFDLARSGLARELLARNIGR
jgi:hypothetical protein